MSKFSDPTKAHPEGNLGSSVGRPGKALLDDKMVLYLRALGANEENLGRPLSDEKLSVFKWRIPLNWVSGNFAGYVGLAPLEAVGKNKPGDRLTDTTTYRLKRTKGRMCENIM